MILCFQCEDLSKIFLVSKFEMNRPNIKLIITFCAIWHYRDLIDGDSNACICSIGQPCHEVDTSEVANSSCSL